MKYYIFFLLFIGFFSNLTSQNNVRKEWKDNIGNYTVPISSLESTNYDDLNFLKDILKDKKYVFIGESSHEIEEYYALRTRLVNFLYDQLGYRVIAFEYEKVLSVEGNNLKNKIDIDSLHQYYLYLKTSKGAHDLMSFIRSTDVKTTGFDIQLNLSNRFHQITKKYFPEIPDSILTHDSLFCKGKYSKFDLVNEWKTIINDTSIFKIGNIPSREIYKNLQNRINWISMMPNVMPVMRDSMMAENIVWLICNAYPNEKIIFLAHNFHISKFNNEYKTMASYLPDTLVQKSYFLGLYGYQGTTGVRGPESPLVKNKPNSLGSILNSANHEIVFCDFSKQDKNKENSWMFKSIEEISYAFVRSKIIPYKYYDGVIQIKNVSATKSWGFQ